MLRSLRHPGFRWLWLSNLAGSAGRWALVLILGVQLYALTHSSFWVGAGLFLTQGPVILLAPLSGSLADRLDRRLLNVASSLLSALVTAAFALLNLLGALSLPAALILCVAFGVSFVVQMTLRSTLVPSLVPPEDLLNGISLSQVGTQGAEFLGPALTTPLLVAGGPALAWAFCSALYLASSALCLPIGEVRAAPGGESGAALSRSFLYLLARPVLMTMVVGVALHCSLTMSYQGMLPMFVSRDLNAGAATYGALLTSIGLGAVAGSLGLAQFSAPRYRPALFLASTVTSGFALTALALAPSGAASLIAGFMVGASQAMFMSMSLALIQSSVDDHFRGRATSVYQMITLAPMAIIGWGMGGLADVVEPRPVMVVSGILFPVAMAAYMWASPWLRLLLHAEGWRGGTTPARAEVRSPA
ncbi:MAG TPA: MFS transporter [Candidatus Nitrosotalea sp.]|nr:MFS transporter [Candidatus Nitrosotalea sp.]